MRAFTMICQRTWCSLIVHVLELIGVRRQVEELVHIHGREAILRGDLRRRAYVLVLRVLVVPSAAISKPCMTEIYLHLICAHDR